MAGPGEMHMNTDWKIRVQPSKRAPYVHEAVFVRATGGDENALEARYLYGDGDLAVLLEDLGAGASEIFRLLDAIHSRQSAEIFIDVTEESMEMLARRETRRA
jgi:hypothetical protein